MKKIYKKPSMRFYEFFVEDVITASTDSYLVVDNSNYEHPGEVGEIEDSDLD